MLSCSLTQMFLVGVDVIAVDGAGQTEQLDRPALLLDQRVDVATRQDLWTNTPLLYPSVRALVSCII